MSNFKENNQKKTLENSKSISKNNRTLLIEFLQGDQNFDRVLIPSEVADKYFEFKTQQEFDKKTISIKNSLDTLISNFNKQSDYKDLKGLKLVESNKTKYSIK